MKLKPSTTRIINIILISACLLIDIGYFISETPVRHFFRTTNQPIESTSINDLKPIDPPISPDLPHKKFEELMQKQKTARSLKNGDYSEREWNFLYTVGTGVYQMCNTCAFKDISPNRESYISLLGWKLKSTLSPYPGPDSVIFHVENGQSFIRKRIIVAPFATKDGRTNYREYEKDIPVKFRYSHKSQLLKIPVSENLKNTVTVTMQVATGLSILICLYAALMFAKLIISLRDGSDFNNQNSFWSGLLIVFMFPLFLVVSLINLLRREISNNYSVSGGSRNTERLVFTDENIFRLQVLAYTLTGFPILLFLLTLLTRLIFSSYFTEDVVLNTARLYPLWITMHVGIIFLLLLNTFKQGKALKDEQDLTV